MITAHDPNSSNGKWTQLDDFSKKRQYGNYFAVSAKNVDFRATSLAKMMPPDFTPIECGKQVSANGSYETIPFIANAAELLKVAINGMLQVSSRV